MKILGFSLMVLGFLFMLFFHWAGFGKFFEPQSLVVVTLLVLGVGTTAFAFYEQKQRGADSPGRWHSGALDRMRLAVLLTVILVGGSAVLFALFLMTSLFV